MRVVEINDRRPAFGKRIKQTAFFFCDTRQRPHAGQMRTLCIGHDRNRRLRQLRQGGDLTRVTHAQFNYGIAVLRPKAQQRQRQPDLVIEITQRIEYRRITHHVTEQMCHQLLGGCLAIRTGNSHHGQIVTRAPGLPQGPQGMTCVITDNQRPTFERRRRQHRMPGFDNGGHGPGFTHIFEKLMGIELRTTQGNKQIARLQCAGIGRHPLHHLATGSVRQMRRQPVGHQRQRHRFCQPYGTHRFLSGRHVSAPPPAHDRARPPKPCGRASHHQKDSTGRESPASVRVLYPPAAPHLRQRLPQ